MDIDLRKINFKKWQLTLSFVSFLLIGLAYLFYIPWMITYIYSSNVIRSVLYILDLILTAPLLGICFILAGFFLVFKNQRFKNTLLLAFFFYGMHRIFIGLSFLVISMDYNILIILHSMIFTLSGLLIVICVFQFDQFYNDTKSFEKLRFWSVICLTLISIGITLDNLIYWLPDVLFPSIARIDNLLQFFISFVFVFVTFLFVIKCRKPDYKNYWMYIFLLIGLFALSMHTPRVFESLLRDYVFLRFISRFIWGIAGIFASILCFYIAYKFYNKNINETNIG